jgi:hypothetical protein
MSRVHRLLASLIPGKRSEWVLAHGAELEAIGDPATRRRWLAGLPAVFARAIVAQLVGDPLSFRGGTLMRTVLATLSVIEVAGGAALLVFAALTDPVGPGTFAAVLLVQGGYTLALLSGALRRVEAPARHLQLAGSAAALFVGLAGFVAGFARNIDPANADPEFAPMTVLLLVALHGLASIATFASPPTAAGRRG